MFPTVQWQEIRFISLSSQTSQLRSNLTSHRGTESTTPFSILPSIRPIIYLYSVTPLIPHFLPDRYLINCPTQTA